VVLNLLLRYNNNNAKKEGKIPCVNSATSMEKEKSKHYGQVLPIEEIEKIFGFISSVVRLPCICRAFCRNDAISLTERLAVVEAANLW
jgi:hypothetical protein